MARNPDEDRDEARASAGDGASFDETCRRREAAGFDPFAELERLVVASVASVRVQEEVAREVLSVRPRNRRAYIPDGDPGAVWLIHPDEVIFGRRAGGPLSQSVDDQVPGMRKRAHELLGAESNTRWLRMAGRVGGSGERGFTVFVLAVRRMGTVTVGVRTVPLGATKLSEVWPAEFSDAPDWQTWGGVIVGDVARALTGAGRPSHDAAQAKMLLSWQEAAAWATREGDDRIAATVEAWEAAEAELRGHSRENPGDEDRDEARASSDAGLPAPDGTMVLEHVPWGLVSMGGLASVTKVSVADEVLVTTTDGYVSKVRWPEINQDPPEVAGGWTVEAVDEEAHGPRGSELAVIIGGRAYAYAHWARVGLVSRTQGSFFVEFRGKAGHGVVQVTYRGILATRRMGGTRAPRLVAAAGTLVEIVSRPKRSPTARRKRQNPGDEDRDEARASASGPSQLAKDLADKLGPGTYAGAVDDVARMLDEPVDGDPERILGAVSRLLDGRGSSWLDTLERGERPWLVWILRPWGLGISDDVPTLAWDRDRDEFRVVTKAALYRLIDAEEERRESPNPGDEDRDEARASADAGPGLGKIEVWGYVQDVVRRRRVWVGHVDAVSATSDELFMREGKNTFLTFTHDPRAKVWKSTAPGGLAGDHPYVWFLFKRPRGGFLELGGPGAPKTVGSEGFFGHESPGLRGTEQGPITCGIEATSSSSSRRHMFGRLEGESWVGFWREVDWDAPWLAFNVVPMSNPGDEDRDEARASSAGRSRHDPVFAVEGTGARAQELLPLIRHAVKVTLQKGDEAARFERPDGSVIGLSASLENPVVLMAKRGSELVVFCPERPDEPLFSGVALEVGRVRLGAGFYVSGQTASRDATPPVAWATDVVRYDVSVRGQRRPLIATTAKSDFLVVEARAIGSRNPGDEDRDEARASGSGSREAVRALLESDDTAPHERWKATVALGRELLAEGWTPKHDARRVVERKRSSLESLGVEPHGRVKNLELKLEVEIRADPSNLGRSREVSFRATRTNSLRRGFDNEAMRRLHAEFPETPVGLAAVRWSVTHLGAFLYDTEGRNKPVGRRLDENTGQWIDYGASQVELLARLCRHSGFVFPELPDGPCFVVYPWAGSSSASSSRADRLAALWADLWVMGLLNAPDPGLPLVVDHRPITAPNPGDEDRDEARASSERSLADVVRSLTVGDKVVIELAGGSATSAGIRSASVVVTMVGGVDDQFSTRLAVVLIDEAGRERWETALTDRHLCVRRREDSVGFLRSGWVTTVTQISPWTAGNPGDEDRDEARASAGSRSLADVVRSLKVGDRVTIQAVGRPAGSGGSQFSVVVLAAAASNDSLSPRFEVCLLDKVVGEPLETAIDKFLYVRRHDDSVGFSMAGWVADVTQISPWTAGNPGDEDRDEARASASGKLTRKDVLDRIARPVDFGRPEVVETLLRAYREGSRVATVEIYGGPEVARTHYVGAAWETLEALLRPPAGVNMGARHESPWESGYLLVEPSDMHVVVTRSTPRTWRGLAKRYGVGIEALRHANSEAHPGMVAPGVREPGDLYRYEGRTLIIPPRNDVVAGALLFTSARSAGPHGGGGGYMVDVSKILSAKILPDRRRS